MVEQADRPFAAESFGTTAEEEEEGESLDQRLKEEQPERPISDVHIVIEDEAGPDDEAELVGEVAVEHDPFISPEEAAVTIRRRPPGVVDHPEEPGGDGA
jgi:hypothetical protein